MSVATHHLRALLRDAETELGAEWGRGRGGGMTPVRPVSPRPLRMTERQLAGFAITYATFFL